VDIRFQNQTCVRYLCRPNAEMKRGGIKGVLTRY
jgi:hypothetical protein